MGLEAMSPAPSRAAVKQLADERDAVERELAATVDALTAPGGGGLSGPLVDAEGFPRADIDVALVRTRRNRVATLRNDVEALSATLHQRLQEVLAPLPLRAQSGRRWWSWCSGRARGVAAACSAATSCPSG